jgi:hypothetical protein
MIWCPISDKYTPREPAWTAIRRQFDPSLYVVAGRWPWSLPITAKPWADLTSTATQAAVGYHDPATWAILGNFYLPEKADPASPTDRTWYEWDRATITDNHIVFTAPVAGRGNQLNRAMRPVILPGHGRYKVSCSFSRNTGTAKLIARGYNAVNGLVATTASSTAASGTLTTTFTTVPHNVRNLISRKSPWFWSARRRPITRTRSSRRRNRSSIARCGRVA